MSDAVHLSTSHQLQKKMSSGERRQIVQLHSLHLRHSTAEKLLQIFTTSRQQLTAPVSISRYNRMLVELGSSLDRTLSSYIYQYYWKQHARLLLRPFEKCGGTFYSGVFSLFSFCFPPEIRCNKYSSEWVD